MGTHYLCFEQKEKSQIFYLKITVYGIGVFTYFIAVMMLMLKRGVKQV